MSFISEDSQGILWIGGLNTGLGRYDLSTGVFTSYSAKPNDQGSLGTNQVWRIFEDRQGVLWLVTWDGLYKIKQRSEWYQWLAPDPENEESIEPGRVGSIIEGPEGNIWFVSANQIVHRFNLETGDIKKYPGDPVAWGSEDSITPTELYSGTSGLLWLKSEIGLYVYDAATDRFLSPNMAPDMQTVFHSDKLSTLIEDSKGRIWASSLGIGLLRFDPGTGTGAQYRRSSLDPYALPSDTTVALLEDSKGFIWVSTPHGISRLDPESDMFRNYSHRPGATRRIGPGFPFVIYEDSQGVLWVGNAYNSSERSVSGGLNRYDPESDTFTSFFEGYNIQCILEDRTGNIWIGTERDIIRTTGGGLILFDRESDGFIRYTAGDGLSSQGILSILEDDEGFLWLGGHRGVVSRLDPFNRTMMAFSGELGISRSDLIYDSALKSKKGTLFWGSGTEIGGLLEVYPGLYNEHSNPPEVLITDIRIANESLAAGNAPDLSEPIYNMSQITLESSQNELAFDFVGIHFEDPQRNQYAYYLENYDSDWVEAGPIRSARYSRVPPGEYVFHVKASNSRDVWNEEGVSLAITILPPWWRTTWIFVVYGLAFGAVVFGVDRFQRRRLLRKAHEKARERELAHAKEITLAHTELQQAHDTLKSTQQQLIQSEKMASLGHLTAGIAHEIKNPLNFVNNFAEMNAELAREIEEQIGKDANLKVTDIRDELSHIRLNAAQIAKHGKRADQIVSRMMEHATDGKSERYDVAINPFVDELVDISYQSFKARLPDLEVHIEKELSDEVGTLYIAPQEMGQVLQNILSNAFEAVHERVSGGDNDYVPRVRVATAQQNEAVEIRVEDNGVGIPRQARDRVFEPFFTTKPTGSGTGLGLSLSYDIVTQGHRGSLSVESEEGAGAAFVIALPLHMSYRT